MHLECYSSLPARLDSMDVSLLLADLNSFLVSYPGSYWKQQLYNLKVENPHVDLELFLAQSSQYFRDYIERGLKKIEEEVKVGSAPV